MMAMIIAEKAKRIFTSVFDFSRYIYFMFSKYLLSLFAALLVLSVVPSCNNNKIACPTYADSFPDQKKKKKKPEPQIPKATKAKSGLLPPNAKHR
jgi:hypothetical protein